MSQNLDQSDATIVETNQERGIWKRGLFMLIFVFLFGIAEAMLFIIMIVQFLWMLFNRETNPAIAEFGKSLGKWLSKVAEFQSGASDEKPFPWAKWE